MFSRYNIDVEPLSPTEQSFLTETIFERIKAGRKPDIKRFTELCRALNSRGCQRVILGCTELSLIKKEHPLPSFVIDSLEVLCISALNICKKTPTGFDDGLMAHFYAEKGI